MCWIDASGSLNEIESGAKVKAAIDVSYSLDVKKWKQNITFSSQRSYLVSSLIIRTVFASSSPTH